MQKNLSWHAVRTTSSALVIWKRIASGFVVLAANDAARPWAPDKELVGLSPESFPQFPTLDEHLEHTLQTTTVYGMLAPQVRLEPLPPDLVVMRIDPSPDDASRFESIGRASAGIAHDFNNLLTVINSYTDLMLGEASGSRHEQLLREVLSAGEKAANLSAKLLAAASLRADTTAQPLDKRPPAPGGSETILLAEDERALRGLLERALTSAGYHVVTAADGADALALIGELRPDLLVTDVVMPRIGGKQLAELLAARHADLRVLYISGYGAKDVANHGLDVGLQLLQKPFSARELLEGVRRVLDASFDSE